jgi:hypothetical protein
MVARVNRLLINSLFTVEARSITAAFSLILRLFKKAVQQGRSKRRGEAYPCGTVSL